MGGHVSAGLSSLLKLVVVPGGLCITMAWTPVMPSPELRGLAYSHSCFNPFPIGLLQHSLHRTILEDHPEASGGQECNDAGGYGHSSICSTTP